MSDDRLDELAGSARSRGLKLVRSRVRTPGKRRFGKVGLADTFGKPAFGMDAKGPTAKPEEVEAYLRDLGAKGWGASLDVAVLPRKRKKPAKAPPRKPANDDRPEPRRSAAPAKPKPQVRNARAADAAALVDLIALLDHTVDAPGVGERIALLAKQDLAPLVATLDDDVVGLCGIHRMVTIHRDRPVGRITILVVAESARGRGIGRMLMQAAEKHLRKLGCGMVEITSNDRLAEAHAFYRHMGYERTSIRFARTL